MFLSGNYVFDRLIYVPAKATTMDIEPSCKCHDFGFRLLPFPLSLTYIPVLFFVVFVHNRWLIAILLILNLFAKFQSLFKLKYYKQVLRRLELCTETLCDFGQLEF